MPASNVLLMIFSGGNSIITSSRSARGRYARRRRRCVAQPFEQWQLSQFLPPCDSRADAATPFEQLHQLLQRIIGVGAPVVDQIEGDVRCSSGCAPSAGS